VADFPYNQLAAGSEGPASGGVQDWWQQRLDRARQRIATDVPQTSWWTGRPVAPGDAPWYLPEDMVGDIPYRYQGVGLHGALGYGFLRDAARRGPGSRGAAALGLANLGYALGSYLTGRTQPRSPPPSNSLSGQIDDPTLGGDLATVAPAQQRTYGKGSVQEIPEPQSLPLSIHRALQSFGQPMYDRTMGRVPNPDPLSDPFGAFVDVFRWAPMAGFGGARAPRAPYAAPREALRAGEVTFTPEMQNRLQQMWNTNERFADIATQVGVAEGTLRRHWPYLSEQLELTERARRATTRPSDDELRRLSGQPTTELARRFNVTPTTVNYWLRDLGLSRPIGRPPASAD
jgi:hypothetical protein